MALAIENGLICPGLKEAVNREEHELGCLVLGPCLVGDGRWRRAAEGQLTWAVHVTIAPTWFDPAETPGIVTPFMLLYALHDGLVKPMPGNAMTPSLAESWSVSKDGLAYEFVLRRASSSTTARPLARRT